MRIFLLFLSHLIRVIRPDGKPAEQDMQSIVVGLFPEKDITTQTRLVISISRKAGTETPFKRHDLFTVSNDFNKKFTYSPYDNVVNINLKKFEVKKQQPGYFEVKCLFEPELDADTHWEVQWLADNGEDIPMTTFFTKADLPTIMEVSCREMFATDCNSLFENDNIIITCMINMGMPFLKAYLVFPPEAAPVVLLSSPRRIEARLKLTRAVYFKKLICGADNVNLTVSRPFQFLLENLTNRQIFDPVLVTIVVTLSIIITITCIILGIYVVLIKPSKERSKEKVVHHVEISTEVKNPMSMASAMESRRSFREASKMQQN